MCGNRSAIYTNTRNTKFLFTIFFQIYCYHQCLLLIGLDVFIFHKYNKYIHIFKLSNILTKHICTYVYTLCDNNMKNISLIK